LLAKETFFFNGLGKRNCLDPLNLYEVFAMFKVITHWQFRFFGIGEAMSST
jgi:hypothetical protein